MTGIIIPSPRGGLVWIHANDPANNPVKIEATAGGILFVTYDGMLDAGERVFGIADVVSEQKSDTSLPTGSLILKGTAIPSGELWRITRVATIYIGTVPGRLIIEARVGTVNVPISERTTVVSGKFYSDMCEIYLAEGDYMQVTAVNATLNDDMHLYYCGTKQAI